AQTVIDPLKGCVNYVCGDPNTTNLNPGSGNTFEFVSDPSGDVGTLNLEILVPVSVNGSSSERYTVTVGSNTYTSVSKGEFTTGPNSRANLVTFLVHPSSTQPPMTNNSLGNVDYYVYQVTLPSETLGGVSTGGKVTNTPQGTVPGPFSITGGYLPTGS